MDYTLAPMQLPLLGPGKNQQYLPRDNETYVQGGIWRTKEAGLVFDKIIRERIKDTSYFPVA